MTPTAPPLLACFEMLGLKCDSVSLDEMTSATAALACFPMYMVANVHFWTGDQKFSVPLVNLPGSETVREALEIGRQEASWEISDEHRQVLKLMLVAARPADRIIYEFALQTIKQFLGVASPALAETIRTGVARMIVAVANASGKGFLGTGEKVSPEELACIRHVSDVLDLKQTEAATWLLEQTGV